MILAPEDRHLSKTIRDLAESNLIVGAERVMFIGKRGEVQDVWYPNQSTVSLLSRRRALLEADDLGAIAHLGLVQGEVAQISLIEVYDDQYVPTVHALLAWTKKHPQWITVPQEAQDRWHDMWKEEEET
jgi:hypothetical protein